MSFRIAKIGQHLNGYNAVLSARAAQENTLIGDVINSKHTPGVLANMFKGGSLLPMFKLFLDFSFERIKDLFDFIKLSNDIARNSK